MRAPKRARRGATFALGTLVALITVLTGAPGAAAFPHVVQKGETLAQIAEHVYGLVERENVLVAANGLDAGGGIAIASGMRLEVPAAGYRRVGSGDTWAALAEALLGDAERSDVLSLSNDSSPWMTPAEGVEIMVPYNLRVLVGPTDTIVTIATRFGGRKEKAWVLDRYNHLGGVAPKRGDVVLVPLTDLTLTPAGRNEAARAEAFERSEAGGGTREAQKRVDAELPALLGDVRAGRYVDAITRGAKMLSYGELAKGQMAAIHRQMLEAYVALVATGLASAACRSWRDLDPLAPLDPVHLSPKIMTACAPPGKLR